MNSQVKLTNTRLEPRFTCSTTQSIGTFTFNNSLFLARPVDVSNRGVGILTNIELKPGSKVTWTLSNQPVQLEVMYCESHLGIDAIYRVGLFSRELENNLVSLVREAGFEDTLHSSK